MAERLASNIAKRTGLGAAVVLAFAGLGFAGSPPAEPEAAAAPAAAPGQTRAALVNALTLPLRPIAAVHEKFSEPTRQLIGYAAVITLFAAACLWAFPHFMSARTPDPTARSTSTRTTRTRRRCAAKSP